MTTPRYRRSSVRAVVERLTDDPAVAARLHDALWAVLWNRGYDDVAEPVGLPDVAYAGMLAFVEPLGAEAAFVGLDAGDAFVVTQIQATPPPVGSRVRIVSSGLAAWRFTAVMPLGLGIELRFETQTPASETAWVDALREGVRRLREVAEQRRKELAARRARLGALQEPSTLEAIWREEVAAIRKRFPDRVNAEVARLRHERWPAIRDAVAAEARRYAEYRTEVVRLEDALHGIRALSERAAKAPIMLDALERSGFHIARISVDPARLDEAAYGEDLLRSIELLFAAIPTRGTAAAANFSAYRAPTAGPSVIPPRV